MWQSIKEFKDSRERNFNARTQNCLEKALYKLTQTENKRVKIRLNFRKYVLSTKVSRKSKKYNQEPDKAEGNLTSCTIQQ